MDSLHAAASNFTAVEQERMLLIAANVSDEVHPIFPIRPEHHFLTLPIRKVCYTAICASNYKEIWQVGHFGSDCRRNATTISNRRSNGRGIRQSYEN